MNGDLNWFKFRDSWIDVFTALSKPESDRLLKAIREYINGREAPEMQGREGLVWIMIKAELDADKEASRKVSEARQKAGAQGGRPKVDPEARFIAGAQEERSEAEIESKPKQKKQLVNLLSEESKTKQKKQLRVKELRVKSSEDREFINCADAQLQTQETEATPALTPDNDAWWSPFGERKDLAIAFFRETKLYPMSGEWGHWQKDLARFVEAGIGADLMVQAIRKIRAEGKLSIKSPGSVFSTARWLLSRQSLPQPPAQTSQRRMSAVEIAELMSENQRLDETEIIDI